jgi:acyl-CoA dehydrogenase
MACRVIDRAIQAFGGVGVTGDDSLAYAYATAGVLQPADGPDEVHRNRTAQVPGPHELHRRLGRGAASRPRARLRQRPA